MKFFKAIAVALLLTALTSQHSIAKPMDDPNSELRSTVTKLLSKPKLNKAVDENVRISFFVTAEEELVVLKTDARTKTLDQFIKARMNYKKIDVENLEINRIFHMKVHFVTE